MLEDRRYIEDPLKPPRVGRFFLFFFFKVAICRAAEHPQLPCRCGSSPLLQIGPPTLLPRLKTKLFTYSLDKAESSSSLVLGFPLARKLGGSLKSLSKVEGAAGDSPALQPEGDCVESGPSSWLSR